MSVFDLNQSSQADQKVGNLQPWGVFSSLNGTAPNGATEGYNKRYPHRHSISQRRESECFGSGDRIDTQSGESVEPRIDLRTTRDQPQPSVFGHPDYPSREKRLDQLQRYFVFPPGPSIDSLLLNYPTVSQLLLEAAPHLQRVFAPATIFELKAPLDEFGDLTVYAVVRWAGSILDVSEALERFDDEWWLANCARASGLLVFTYELI